MVPALQLLLGTAGFGRDALFYSLVFLHALAALVGFGSIGFAGTYAASAYLPSDRPQGANQEPASAPVQPADGTAQPEPAPLAPPEVGTAVPDYETALLKYQAALREFEMSGPEDDASQTGDETATGHAEEVPSVVGEVIVGEVVAQAGPATSAVAVEPDDEAEEMRRYFAHPARLWGALVLVPFLGAAALAAQPNGKGFDQPWVFGALAVWLAATLVAGSLVVPALHQMQAVLLKSDNPEASPAARSALGIRFARAGRIASRSAAFCDVLFVIALALMIFRP